MTFCEAVREEVRMQFEYDFLRLGSSVEPRRRHIYLDLGNQSGDGVVDTHAFGYADENFECSSSLIAAQPSIVTSWISPDELEHPITLVMHEDPDYDCIASSFLVVKLLEARASGLELPEGWGQWAQVLGNAARRIDRGD